MTTRRHAARLVLVTALAAGLDLALLTRADVTSSEAAEAIAAARRIQGGGGLDITWSSGARPLHAAAIAALHRLSGGQSEASWRMAAQALSLAVGVLLAVPVHLLALEIYEAGSAWLGCVLFLCNPVLGYVVVNMLPEGLFLLFWSWGAWAALRAIKDGRAAWLFAVLPCAALASWVRPEGLWLLGCYWAAIGLTAGHWASPVRLSRWWPAFLILSVLSAAACPPFVGAWRSLAVPSRSKTELVAQSAQPHRDSASAEPRPLQETRWVVARRAFVRVLKVTRNALSVRLVPFAMLGLVLAWSGVSQARVWLFLGLAMLGGLGHVLGRQVGTGECSAHDALIPALLLTLAAGHGLHGIARRVMVDGAWCRRPGVAYQPGPLAWAAVVGALFVLPGFRTLAPARSSGGFASYDAAGAWLAERHVPASSVRDLTGWVVPAAGTSRDDDRAVPRRWVIARQGQVLGHRAEGREHAIWLEDETPVARFPALPAPKGLQVWVFDGQAVPEKKDLALGLRLISGEKQSNVKH